MVTEKVIYRQFSLTENSVIVLVFALMEKNLMEKNAREWLIDCWRRVDICNNYLI
jgi:hypothetical protein